MKNFFAMRFCRLALLIGVGMCGGLFADCGPEKGFQDNSKGSGERIGVSATALRLESDGSLIEPETGLQMRYLAYRPGWKGSMTSANVPGKGWQSRFPDAGKGEAAWTLGDGLGRGRTRVVRGKTAGAVEVRVDFTAARPFATECAMWSVSLPARVYAGGSVTLDGKKPIRLPVELQAKKPGLGGGTCRRVRLAAHDGGELVFSFAEPVSVAVQDSRKWGGENLTVRLFAKKRAFAAGDRTDWAFVVTDGKGALTVDCARPTIIRAGTDWIPVDYRKDIVAGSALDLSGQGLQDAPAGKYGWTKVGADGHFEFERLPGVFQRFYGVNLCFSANYLTHEVTDAFVTRLVRFGYNALRIHHYERDLLVKPGTLEFRPDQMDRFDYLMAQAIKAGIYVTTDIFVSRPVTWPEIGLAERGKGVLDDKTRFKHLVALWDPAFESWKAFAKALLGHVNPYTGRAYLDEPALNLISLVNEGQLSMHWKSSQDDPIVRSAYAKWLAEKRAADPSFLPGAPTEASGLRPYGKDAAAVQAMMLFMTDVERRSATRMIAALREMGSKALFTNANNGPHPVAMQEVRADVYDYVDDHFYVDHPHFLEKRWRLPSRIRNLNPVLDPRLNLLQPTTVRLADKPMCITEWNFSGPGQYRGVGGIMTGAYAALQSWDGLWRFAYSHKAEDVAEGPGLPGYFNVGTDPLGQASDRASVCLFLRRDLAPLPSQTALRLPGAEASAALRAAAVQPRWLDACWGRRVATAAASTHLPAGTDEVALTGELLKSETAPFAETSAASVSLDRSRGAFTIDTSRLAGGFAPAGTLEAGPVRVTVSGGAATVWATSVDREKTDVAHARRLLVTHLTDVQADGNVYADAAKTILLQFGAPRPVARTGRAEVRLALTAPEACVVWVLDTAGNRLEKVPSRITDGALVFNAEVAPPTARLYYEVVRTESAR